jgi:hypothetical protein
MLALGQWAVPLCNSAMASLGEGGSCGHHTVTSGWRLAKRSHTMRALVERGEDLKPCR